MDFFHYGFLVRGLLAALLVGATAPTIGAYLMQRRLSLIGDGLGHVAFAGVAMATLTGTAPIPTALVVACAGAVTVELVRASDRTGGDVALAILFYGGIAGGVVVMSLGSGGGRSIDSYLFGSLTTTTRADVVVFAVLSALVLAVTVGGRRLLFAVSADEEFARASGLPVTAVNVALAVLTAVTVVIAMRVVGLLLVAAMMIVPVATARIVTRSFASTQAVAVGLGTAAAGVGVFTSYRADTPPGGTIVVVAVGVFALAGVAVQLRRVLRRSGSRRRRPPDPGGAGRR